MASKKTISEKPPMAMAITATNTVRNISKVFIM
jgi:hypothetical protein